MKKVLVTGHNGYIGPHLVRLLLEKGYEVVGIDVDYFDKDCELYPDPQEGLTEIHKDIRKIDAGDLEGIYAVCHLAALSNDPIGELNDDLTYDINHRASVRLAEASKAAGVDKFIYSSSCSLYGVAGDDDILDETADFAPVTAYAKSKVKTEQDVTPMGDDDFCVTFLRNATAFGVSPKLRTDIVVNNLSGWAVTKGKIVIMSDGSPWRPLVHAEDIARAFVACVEAPSEAINKQAFNVGMNSETYRVREVAAMVKEVMPECVVEITNEHGADSRSYQVSFDKISKVLPNFKPKWTVKMGIEELIAAYRKYDITFDEFNSRKFVRLKQIKHLTDNDQVDENLYRK